MSEFEFGCEQVRDLHNTRIPIDAVSRSLT
jgi:hypothetical protein